MHARLARTGLISPREAAGDVRLAAFIDGYLAQRLDLKESTLIVMRQARRHLVNTLGDVPLAQITPADGDKFRAAMLGRGCARSSVNKWQTYARHFMEVARRRRLIQENPFAHLKGGVVGDPSKRVFVPATDVLRVMEVVPDPQWRLLIALGRWGGLRIPSEALALRWSDIDWERLRFTVHSPKTAHHLDGGIRITPIFPQLMPLFQAVFDEAEPGTEHVITRYRDPAANLRTQFVRYVLAAGLKPWPKPWQNMRASRATELADEYPSHVAAAWLGHTEAIADSFYRQVTEEHFQKAAQKAAQHDPAPVRAELRNPEIPEENDVVRSGAKQCEVKTGRCQNRTPIGFLACVLPCGNTGRTTCSPTGKPSATTSGPPCSTTLSRSTSGPSTN
ncbi:MAG TPA: site-specific integrase [Phycisphaerae bacterium]|nr:site-specific integrase [Phycisphaerae bacterium]